MKKFMLVAMMLVFGAAFAVAADDNSQTPPADEQTLENEEGAKDKPTATWTNPAGKEITNHGMHMKLQNQERRELRKQEREEVQEQVQEQQQDQQPPAEGQQVTNEEGAKNKPVGTWMNPQGKEIKNHGMHKKMQNQQRREMRKQNRAHSPSPQGKKAK